MNREGGNNIHADEKFHERAGANGQNQGIYPAFGTEGNI